MAELLFKVRSIIRALLNANVWNDVRKQMREIFVFALEELLYALCLVWYPNEVWEHLEVFVPSVNRKWSLWEWKLEVFDFNLLYIMKSDLNFTISWYLLYIIFIFVIMALMEYFLWVFIRFLVCNDLIHKSVFVVVDVIFNWHLAFLAIFLAAHLAITILVPLLHF